MIIGVLKETKSQERRVAMTPQGAKALVASGHSVLIEKNAGVGAGFSDADYRLQGAAIAQKPDALIRKSDLVVKVKEPTVREIKSMRPGQLLFCYLHLAAFPELTQKILKQKIVALGYETLLLADGSLPLLAPMSEIAGKLATQNGAHFLRADQGGRGVLIGGTEKVAPADVVILGAGVVGTNAARIAAGMGARTHLVDVAQSRLERARDQCGELCQIYASNSDVIADLVPKADLLIGAVLIPGAHAPKLVSKALVKKMKKGSVVLDVAVDQGGCIETSEVTTHDKPIIVKHGVLHYGVANIPGAVPVTATLALTQETIKYIQAIADYGLEAAIYECPEIQHAINCASGQLAHPALKTMKF